MDKKKRQSKRVDLLDTISLANCVEEANDFVNTNLIKVLRNEERMRQIHIISICRILSRITAMFIGLFLGMYLVKPDMVLTEGGDKLQ